MKDNNVMIGWIAIYNGHRIEILKSEADGIYNAKKIAIIEFKKKFKRVNINLITIAPGYNKWLTTYTPATALYYIV